MENNLIDNFYFEDSQPAACYGIENTAYDNGTDGVEEEGGKCSEKTEERESECIVNVTDGVEEEGGKGSERTEERESECIVNVTDGIVENETCAKNMDEHATSENAPDICLNGTSDVKRRKKKTKFRRYKDVAELDVTIDVKRKRIKKEIKQHKRVDNSQRGDISCEIKHSEGLPPLSDRRLTVSSEPTESKSYVGGDGDHLHHMEYAQYTKESSDDILQYNELRLAIDTDKTATKKKHKQKHIANSALDNNLPQGTRKPRDAEGDDVPVKATASADASKHMNDLFLASYLYENSESANFQTKTDNDSVTPKRKRKKNKNHLKHMKKASSKVGFVLPESDETAKVGQAERRPGTESRDKQNDQSLLLSPKSLSSESVSCDNPEDKSQKSNEKHPKPLWICRIIATYPLTSFFVISLVHLATFGTTAGLALSGYNVFPLVFDELPLYIFNDARLKELAWKSRNVYDGWVYRPVYGQGFQSGYRSQVKDTVEIIYEKPGVNILTQYYLEWIKKTEDRLFNIREYQRYYCYLKTYYTCLKPMSLIRLFDGTYSDIDPVFSDPEFNNVTNVIYMASVYNDTKEYVELFLGKDSVVTPDYVSGSITRSFFVMGWPLGRMADYSYGTLTDLQNFLVNSFKPEIENIRDFFLVETLDTYYLSKIMYEYDLSRQALKDLMLAIGSASFIFVFMTIQTGSIFITFLGIMSILSSFFMTNLIYRYILQYVYFGFFHVISIFLILGIGADDLFVFYDTWRLTGLKQYPSDAHRLSDCYRKAAKTTFVTSCTTMMAFFVSGLSPLLPVKTFGIFSGLLVLLNYIWVIVYFPAIIMMHHVKVKYIWYRFRNLLCSCSCFNKHRRKRRNSETSVCTISESMSDSSSSKDSSLDTARKTGKYETDHPKGIMKDSANNGSADIMSDKTNDILQIHFKDKKKGTEIHVSDENRDPIDLKAIEEQSELQEWKERQRNKPRKTFDKRNKIVKFLKNAFFDFMTLRIVKFLVPLILIMVSIFFIQSATKLEPDTHQLRLWRSTHNYAKASNRHYFSFLRNLDDEYQRLYLVWGLEESDVSGCNMKSADFCLGNNRRDEEFDMNTQETQLAFKSMCERLDNIDEATADKLRIRRDSITGKLQVSCFTDAFDKYFQNEANRTSGSSRKYPEDISLTIPITPGNVSTFMSKNNYIYSTQLPSDYRNYFEILVAYWLTNAYTVRATADYFHFNSLLTEEAMEDTQYAYFYESGLFYGSRLRYLAVEVNTTMNVYSLGYQDGLPVYDAWENFIKSINADMPHPVNKGFQVTENLWHWIHVQEVLANSAIMGIVIGLCSAWPILVLTTFNFIIGTMAVVTIGLVTACVVGMIPLAGWKLGVLESINLCMVVGLSVDYIVHLAEAYRMSESEKRLDKVRDMLESIGLSVVSGAFTTIGAAVFMLFAQIQFFFQFGIFIISTVGIALMFSLLGFTTLMSICGPQGRTGSLMPVCTALCARLERVDGEKDDKLKCVGPTVITDRLYHWLSYRGDNQK